jgi:hypothetical protein
MDHGLKIVSSSYAVLCYMGSGDYIFYFELFLKWNIYYNSYSIYFVTIIELQNSIQNQPQKEVAANIKPFPILLIRI